MPYARPRPRNRPLEGFCSALRFIQRTSELVRNASADRGQPSAYPLCLIGRLGDRTPEGADPFGLRDTPRDPPYLAFPSLRTPRELAQALFDVPLAGRAELLRQAAGYRRHSCDESRWLEVAADRASALHRHDREWLPRTRGEERTPIRPAVGRDRRGAVEQRSLDRARHARTQWGVPGQGEADEYETWISRLESQVGDAADPDTQQIDARAILKAFD